MGLYCKGLKGEKLKKCKAKIAAKRKTPAYKMKRKKDSVKLRKLDSLKGFRYEKIIKKRNSLKESLKNQKKK